MNEILPAVPYVLIVLGLYALNSFSECHFGICDYIAEYKRLRRRPRPVDPHCQYVFRSHEQSAINWARDYKWWRPVWAWVGGSLVGLGLLSFMIF